MFSESAAWYDRLYDGKDYAGEARRVTELVRRHRPEAWIEGGTTTVDVVEDGDRKLVRVIASGRRGAISVLRMHYAVAGGGEVVTADERHELRLYSHDEYAAAFLAAGLDTGWDPEGLTGRGLLIGVAPG